MKSIHVSAPGKLMLYGEHAVVYDRPCIVTAVDQRLTVRLSVVSQSVFHLEAPDVGIARYEKPLSKLSIGDIPKGARFIEGAVNNVLSKHPLTGGVRIETSSDLSASTGFGSSSASAVCTVKALSELFNLNLSNREIFDICYETVIEIQGVGSGFDIAAAIYGGTLYFVTGGVRIEPLTLTTLPLVIGYSGIKADTASIVKDLKKRYEGREDERNQIFNQITGIVENARAALETNDWKKAGALMNENQKLLSELGVTSEKLDSLNTAAVQAGAYGAKLSGAGVGDCMIALVSSEVKNRVEQAIEDAEGHVIHVNSHAEGVRVEQ